MLLLACVCFLGIRKGLGQSEERAQGRKKKRERVGDGDRGGTIRAGGK